MNNPICGYGCGLESNYPPKKGTTKWCCSEKFLKCPGMIKKMNLKKKGRSWDEMYGKEKADELRKINSESMKEKNPMKNSEPWNKGKVGVYSEETLLKMRNQRTTKGKSWEEIYGVEKSIRLKNNLSEKTSIRLKGSTPWNKNKKNCFSRETIKKMKISHKKTWTKEKREYYSKKFTMNLEDYQKKYPIFCLIEEMRENDHQIIEVKCKYCNEWFIPSPSQLKERVRSIENKQGNMKTYMYCCKEHQYLCPCSIRINPSTISDFENYSRSVVILTEKNVKQHKDKIKNIELRGTIFGYQLDHKFSIREGFNNNIPPEIISHYKNFKIIKTKLNQSKGKDCSISLEFLKKEIDEVSKYE